MSVDWGVKILSAVASADGQVTEGEVRVISSFGGLEPSSPLLPALGPVDPVPMDTLLEELPEIARAQSFGFNLLTFATAVAASDGVVDDNERAYLYRLGKLYRFDEDLVDLAIDSRSRHVKLKQ